MIHKSPLMDGPPMDAPLGGRPDDPSARHRAPRRVVRLGLARHMSLLIGGVLLLFGGLQWLPAASLTVLGWAGLALRVAGLVWPRAARDARRRVVCRPVLCGGPPLFHH